jgi:hypothetical protein
MNLTNIMYKDQTDRVLFERRTKIPSGSGITGHPLLDEYILRLIGHADFKTVLTHRDVVQYRTLPEPRLARIDFNDERTMYVQEETFKLEILRDHYGNEVCFYYHEPENTLYLQKKKEYIHYVTVYEWDYDKTRFKLFANLDSLDGFPRFEGLHYSSKAIIAIITKSELRHMWE